VRVAGGSGYQDNVALWLREVVLFIALFDRTANDTGYRWPVAGVGLVAVGIERTEPRNSGLREKVP
jgi:hypothetical protein